MRKLKKEKCNVIYIMLITIWIRAYAWLPQSLYDKAIFLISAPLITVLTLLDVRYDKFF